jgi:hypothetical protein
MERRKRKNNSQRLMLRDSPAAGVPRSGAKPRQGKPRGTGREPTTDAGKPSETGAMGLLFAWQPAALTADRSTIESLTIPCISSMRLLAWCEESRSIH